MGICDRRADRRRLRRPRASPGHRSEAAALAGLRRCHREGLREVVCATGRVRAAEQPLRGRTLVAWNDLRAGGTTRSAQHATALRPRARALRARASEFQPSGRDGGKRAGRGDSRARAPGRRTAGADGLSWLPALGAPIAGESRRAAGARVGMPGDRRLGAPLPQARDRDAHVGMREVTSAG